MILLHSADFGMSLLMLKCRICDADCANRSQGRSSPGASPAIRSLDTQKQNISAMHETDYATIMLCFFSHDIFTIRVTQCELPSPLIRLDPLARSGFPFRRASASISALTDTVSRRIYFLRCHPMVSIAAYCFWSSCRSTAQRWRVIPSSSIHILWQARESDISIFVESLSDLQTCTSRHVRGSRSDTG